MILLSLIHWIWHRFDLSLDAVIKYFASGFFICTNLCILYEMIVAILTSIIVYLISLLGALGLVLAGTITFDDGIFSTSGGETEAGDDVDFTLFDGNAGSKVQEIHDHEQQHVVRKFYRIIITLLAAFLNAFFVAALVEEIGKYLCFWMIEHPDLENNDKPVFLPPLGSVENTKGMDKEDDEGDPTEGMEDKIDDEKTKLRLQHTHTLQTTMTSEPIKAPAQSLESRGSAITIAMVTTALGFACAENLLCT
jgi:hypothetical protein